MSTAVLLNPSEIKQLQFRIVSPSRFLQLGRQIRKTADVVKREWNNFSPEDRETFRELAYELIELPTGIRRLPLGLWAKAYMLFLKATKQEKEFFFCLDALDILIDNILDAIEREDQGYQQALSDTLEELSSNSGAGEPVDADRRGKWLRQLSNQALSEV